MEVLNNIPSVTFICTCTAIAGFLIICIELTIFMHKLRQ